MQDASKRCYLCSVLFPEIYFGPKSLRLVYAETEISKRNELKCDAFFAKHWHFKQGKGSEKLLNWTNFMDWTKKNIWELNNRVLSQLRLASRMAWVSLQGNRNGKLLQKTEGNSSGCCILKRMQRYVRNYFLDFSVLQIVVQILIIYLRTLTYVGTQK